MSPWHVSAIRTVETKVVEGLCAALYLKELVAYGGVRVARAVDHLSTFMASARAFSG
jgi:hypothetical protein